MQTADFDFELPQELIAQHPVEPRDASRLLVLERRTGVVHDHDFIDLPTLLNPGDLLVLNNTKVLAARLFGYKQTGGQVELLLLQRERQLIWEVLVGGKGLTPGVKIERIGDRPELEALVIEDLGGARRRVQFSLPIGRYLNEIGQMPLPPYIKERLGQPERYQTVYAEHEGAAAAPTAGLHFTPRIFDELTARGIRQAFVTLHVGIDTFAPISEDDVTEHEIHTERCQMDRDTAQLINQTIEDGGRVVAVGTTSVRTIETAAGAVEASGKFMMGTRPLVLPAHMERQALPVAAFSGPTSLYITPGYRFRTVSAMLTNFHTPRSTNLVMVAAFCEPSGRDKIMSAYRHAMAEKYRFFSFGDAMLIL